MKFFLLIPILCLAAVMVYLIAFYTASPNVEIKATFQPTGKYRLDLKPNFVVNNIYRIRVSDAMRVLLEREGPIAGPQHVMLPSGVSRGAIMTVECDLQYDRIVPSTLTVRKSITLR